MDKTTDKTGATTAEGDAKSALLVLAREVQNAARQKYAAEKPGELKDYCIGSNIDQNRAALEQAVAGMVKRLETNILPGITAVKVTALGAAPKTYQESDTVQAGAGREGYRHGGGRSWRAGPARVGRALSAGRPARRGYCTEGAGV